MIKDFSGAPFGEKPVSTILPGALERPRLKRARIRRQHGRQAMNHRERRRVREIRNEPGRP
jgi:hypothetical protein